MYSPERASISSLLIAACALLAACSDKGDEISVAEPAMDTLVSAAWLEEHLDDPDLVVLDATVIVQPDGSGGFVSVNGRPSYESGHIPTAGFADLFGDLSDGDSPHEFTRPSPEQFAAAMEALGVSDDSRVVLYDAVGSMWAARVWWMLRWIGFDRAALLDGGLNAWTAGGRPLSTEPASRPAGQLTVNHRPELFADRDEVLASIEDDAVTLIDSLPPPYFRGETTMYDRPGHITGAVNVPVFLAFDDTGRFRPLDEAASIFEGDRDGRAINYCGGGIAASSNAFVMTRLGFTNVAVYDASLQEWTADPDLPMEVDLESFDSED
jgi:thiosulfate/3-mercaptopyruvate sulfurtransferase